MTQVQSNSESRISLSSSPDLPDLSVNNLSIEEITEGAIARRVRIRIPQHYHQEPVISQLVSQYQLTVNIMAAILGADANGGGWFDLSLHGHPAQIDQALAYLHSLELDLWDENTGGDW